MNSTNGFFQKMCREAADELARGKVSIKDTPTNTLLLACFGMLTNHLTHQLSKPLWFFAGSVCAAVIGYFVKSLLGG